MTAPKRRTPRRTASERRCTNCGSAVAANKSIPMLCDPCRSLVSAAVSADDSIAKFILRHKKTLKGLAKK